MQGVKAKQRKSLPDPIRHQQMAESCSKRQRGQKLHAGLGRPECQLVKWQKIAGIRLEQCQKEQHAADHPVHLARPLIRAGQDHPQSMEHYQHEQGMRGQAMQAAQIFPPPDGRFKKQHRIECALRRRLIVDQQQHAGDQHDQKCRKSQAA